LVEAYKTKKMILNKFIRTFKRNTVDSFINQAGLSVAMVVFIFISLYVENEITYDNYLPNADRIFRITTALTSPNGETTDMALANAPFAQILKNRCPEIEDIVCIEADIGDRYELKFAENNYENINIRKATPSIFKVFSYPVVYGKTSDFLSSPNTIVLTESLSRKIFGNLFPLGQKVSIGESTFEVTGVIKDLPTNTDLQFSALIPSDFNGTGELADWGDCYVYIQTLSPYISDLNKKITQITVDEYTNFMKEMGGFQLVHRLQPLKSIHFDNTKLADSPKGNKTMVYVFSIIALLILIIAGINYNNLTLSQIEKRKKEFSILKTTGCTKQQILFQIIGESLLNIFLSIVISAMLALLLLPLFNNLFSEDFQFVSILKLAIPLLTIFVFFGILSALYPALKTANTSQVHKQGFNLFGKSLVIFQNTVSIVMIAGLFLVWSQVHFMKTAELGFDKEQLLAISIPPEPDNFPGKEALRQEFTSLTEVKSLAFGGGGTNLGMTNNWMKAIMAVKDENGNKVQFVLNLPQIDENYIDLFEIELLDGRNFSANIPGDTDRAIIINEAYARIMGWKNPVGKTVGDNSSQTIIGVVKDFNFDALYNPIEPLSFTLLKEQPSYLFLKIEPKEIHAIREKWESLYPDEPFTFQFMNKHMAGLYQQQEKDMTTLSYLTLVAILISCMGLYGLTSHFCLNRTKEIGIRKVNGARISEVLIMLNKDFVKWVAIAFVIATPLAYYAMHKWLENFAYKTELSWWIFALAGLLALGIALLTVSWQSWRAATRNPVEALRYE
jgi:putative ABC transport system permease protein